MRLIPSQRGTAPQLGEVVAFQAGITGRRSKLDAAWQRIRELHDCRFEAPR